METFKESGENGREWTINEKYSHQDFTNMDFTQVDPSDFSNMATINSCFYQTPRPGKTPPYEVLSSGIENGRFIACNMDNVIVESGMDISDDGWNKGSNRTVVN